MHLLLAGLCWQGLIWSLFLVPGTFFQHKKQIPFSVFFRLLDSFWFEMREDTKIGTSGVGAGSMQSKNIPPSSDPMALVISFLMHLSWSGCSVSPGNFLNKVLLRNREKNRYILESIFSISDHRIWAISYPLTSLSKSCLQTRVKRSISIEPAKSHGLSKELWHAGCSKSVSL